MRSSSALLGLGRQRSVKKHKVGRANSEQIGEPKNVVSRDLRHHSDSPTLERPRAPVTNKYGRQYVATLIPPFAVNQSNSKSFLLTDETESTGQEADKQIESGQRTNRFCKENDRHPVGTPEAKTKATNVEVRISSNLQLVQN